MKDVGVLIRNVNGEAPVLAQEERGVAKGESMGV